MYFNTTNLKDDELKQAIQNASNQEDKVIIFFKAHRGNYTPCEVQDLMDLKDTPLTSIRRAITNLTDKGELKKTTLQRIGLHGKKANTWELNTINGEGSFGGGR